MLQLCNAHPSALLHFREGLLVDQTLRLLLAASVRVEAVNGLDEPREAGSCASLQRSIGWTKKAAHALDGEDIDLTKEFVQVLDSPSADALRGVGGQLGVVVVEELLRTSQRKPSCADV